MKPLEVALGYIGRGWSPVPIPHRKKGPIVVQWQKLRITEETAPQYFNGKPQNIGVLLGEPSGWMVDLDMDWHETAELRRHFVPETLTFGRAGNPSSHALVISPGATTRKFQLAEDEGGTVLEIRSTGTQTVFPGSTHPSGEKIDFDNDCPVWEIAPEELAQLCREWAAASVLLRYWKPGVRDDFAAALCGVLLRGSWSPADTNTFVGIVAEVAGDESVKDRLKAERLAVTLERGGHVPGMPRLRELLGGAVADKVADWLDLKEADNSELNLDGAVVLPSDHVPFTNAAGVIFPRFAERRELFVRGDAVVELRDGIAAAITSQEFRSRIEGLGPTFRHFRDRGGWKLEESRCPTDVAQALLATREAKELLPPLRLIVRQPLLTEDGDGQLILLKPGYNVEAGGVLVQGNYMPEDVPLPKAVAALLDIVVEFEFVAEGDRSRGVAAFVTPALSMGGFLKGRIPLDVREADQSQAGKTYMQAMVRAVYSEEPYMIAQRRGGVGSLDESIAGALMSGRPFVAFDNIRGALDSPVLEAVLTAPGAIACRVPYRGEVHIDPRGILFQLTSNGVEITADLANRSSIVRIRKRRGAAFRPLLEIIEARQPFYLGCVYAVVREWHRQGKPRNSGVEHDFRDWAGMLDWIVRELFSLAPLMQGHRGLQSRVSDPAMIWLRELSLMLEREGLADGLVEFSASRLFALCREHEIRVPGGADSLDEVAGAKRVGQLMGRLFRDAVGDRLDVDGTPVCRLETTDVGGRRIKCYLFGEVPLGDF